MMVLALELEPCFGRRKLEVAFANALSSVATSGQRRHRYRVRANDYELLLSQLGAHSSQNSSACAPALGPFLLAPLKKLAVQVLAGFVLRCYADWSPDTTTGEKSQANTQ